MKVRTIVVLVTLFTAPSLGAVAQAQTTAEPRPAPPSILLKLEQPSTPAAVDSMNRDDIRTTPPPKVDKLSEAIHTQVLISDPRCEPGEDVWGDMARLRRPGRRR